MGSYKYRSITGLLTDMFKYFPVVVVSGARQVGKSTLLGEVFESQADHVIFDPVVDIENARKDPDLFLQNRKTPLILDEIQYVPQLASAIKRRLDKSRSNGLYLVTGSQQWEVMKSLSESLAGRVAFLDLHGFSSTEICEERVHKHWIHHWLDNPNKCIERIKENGVHTPQWPHTLYEHIWRGWLPETAFLPERMIPVFYQSYVSTYIDRDIRFMADVKDLDQFHRFFRLASALSAQKVNGSQLGREIGVTPQTVQRWLNMLKASFQWFEIPAWSTNSTKKISKKPKGYLTDTGLISQMQQMATPISMGSNPLWGAAFETAVVNEIRKQLATMASPPSLSHWRCHSGAEVDLILERDNWLFPIEIKSKSHPTRNDTRGLQRFRDHIKNRQIAPGVVVAPADSFYSLTGNDYCMPWDAHIL